VPRHTSRSLSHCLVPGPTDDLLKIPTRVLHKASTS
jgi:hypothetical protein